MTFQIDEKGFIAIAFFVCIGLILKFFGKTIISSLNAKKNCINGGLYSIENQLKSSEKEFEDLTKEEKNIKNFANTLVKNTEQERISSLEKFKKDLDLETQKKIAKQKKLNEELHSEFQNEFSKISWNASKDLLKIKLVGEEFGSEKNKKIHQDLVNKFLKI
jgi:F0F1-type ATP synthase membrane subunit b/b'